MESRTPYPPSEHLRLVGLEESVRRDDLDGDNWPLTWADDDLVYAGYGDGWGCRPVGPPTKLNTGMITLAGDPPGWRAEEQPIPFFGGGAQNPNMKGCGLLSIGGTLYHFLRYQVDPPRDPNNPPVRRREVPRIQVAAALIWSKDHGATWEGDTAYTPDAADMHFFFDEPDHAFNSPTFLQAGKDYAEAPDGYVYVYSPREDRRRRNDHLHLARVRREHVAERDAYEFFHGFSDVAGERAPDRPRWTHDVTQHIPVFAFPEHVGAGDVVYLPGLRRYLLVTCRAYARHDERASSPGLFDAPHPWGPWTTVGYVPEWGSGREGDCRYDPRLPAKWVARDGRSALLVFSDRTQPDVLNYQWVRLEPLTPHPPPAARFAGTRHKGERGVGSRRRSSVSFEWNSAAPEEAGLDSAALEAARENLAQLGTTGFLVAQRDRIVCEWYAPEWSAARPHFTASLAKALVGGTSLLVALSDGLVDPDDRAAQYVPQWSDDPLKSQITIRHLATHSSGLDDANQDGVPHEQLPGWMGRFWKREPDPFTLSRDVVPVVFEPGTSYLYSNPGMAMLSYCVTAALQKAPAGTPRDVRSLLKQQVYDSIGLREAEWSIGYGTAYRVDGMELWANWGGGSFTARAAAKIARLLLRGGDWEGRQLLDRGWVERALLPAGTPLPSRVGDAPNPASGLCWYTNRDGVWPAVPRDAFAGSGAQHQVLLAVPSLDLIVVRNGQNLNQGHNHSSWAATYEHIFAPVMAAIRD